MNTPHLHPTSPLPQQPQQPLPAETLRHRYELAGSMAADADRALELSGPATLENIQAHLESVRGRPIVIREMASLANTEVCGLWFGLDELDLVCHAATGRGMHRQQIILHEFSHILLNHEHQEFRAGQFSTVFPDLDSNTVVRALMRGSFGSVTEMSAEILADRLSERIRTARRAPAGTDRFARVFG